MGKFIFHTFFGLLFFFLIQRVSYNIYFFDKTNLEKGIITEINVFEGDTESPTIYITKVKSGTGNFYENHQDVFFDCKVGDSVLFRNIYNSKSGTILITKVDKTEVNSYYNFVDYISPFLIICIVCSYLFIPKILKNNTNISSKFLQS